jgi:hypothetical protein
MLTYDFNILQSFAIPELLRRSHLFGKAGDKVCLLGRLSLASDLLILPNGTIKDVDLGISEHDSRYD